jgi:metal-dependent HD superfamily phosphatase/phosphodiesterase
MGENKDNKLIIRIESTLKDIIQSMASQNNMTVSEYVRDILIQNMVKESYQKNYNMEKEIFELYHKVMADMERNKALLDEIAEKQELLSKLPKE